MNRVLNAKPPTWFWLASALALLWSLIGVWTYLEQVTMTPADLARMPDGMRTLYETAPVWQTGAFAVAVFSGLIGCVGLLLRKMWARTFFIISLVAVLVQFFWPFFMADGLSLIGPSGAIMPAIIVAVTAFLIWLANIGIQRGWLR